MKKRERDEYARSTAIGTLIIVLIAVLLFAGVFYWMYSVKLLWLPESLKKLFGFGANDSDDTLPWDNSELAGAVRSGKSTGDIELFFDVNYETLRAALLGEPEPEGIYQNLRVRYYDGGEAVPHRVIFVRDGDRFRIERYADDMMMNLCELIVADDKTLYYRDMSTGELRGLPRAADISPESEAGLPTIDDLLSVVGEAFGETSASEPSEESRYADCELMLLRTDAGNVYYVAYNDTLLGLREEYYISLDNRVILNHNTYSGERLVYSCETLSFSTDRSVYGNNDKYKIS